MLQDYVLKELPRKQAEKAGDACTGQRLREHCGERGCNRGFVAVEKAGRLGKG